MKLYIDTREHKNTLDEFKAKANKDTEIISVKLDTYDMRNEVAGFEFKSIDDFVSAVINISERKTKEDYQRMEAQFQRMCDDKRPLKILFIHGSLENAHTKLHPNSFRGMLASYAAKGAMANPPVQVMYISDDDFDWVDYVLRLHNKSMKYIEHHTQSKLMIGAD